MLRILRAFAWMRWRVLLNSLERTGARDRIERLSLAVEQIGPIVAGLLLVPSALGLAALAGYAGYTLAGGTTDSIAFQILRFLLVAACVLAVAGPIMLPGAERTNAVRLLLLPIPRRVLYIAQTASGLSDPWILLVLPTVVALPAGLAAAGAAAAAFSAAATGLAFTMVLLGLSSLTTMALHLVVRDRRRGELLGLLFVVLFPLVALAPSLIEANERRSTREERGSADGRETLPAWALEAGELAFSLIPSELHTRAARRVAGGQPFGAVMPLAVLIGSALAFHGLGMLAFGRLLDSPSVSGPRRAAGSARAWTARIPGLSRGASAVALAQLRLALRTTRGRSILLSPLLVFAMFALLMLRGGGGMQLGFVTLRSGLALAAFGSAVSLLSILPFAMNQFAIDRAGLTLALLLPLRESELLTGKAVGNALVAGVPALMCIAGAYVLMPGGSAALWLSLPPGLASTYLLAAPAAAALSTLFPRAADLNSIGRASNAHGLAGLLGILAFAAGAAPALLLTLLATRVLDRPLLAPALLLAWCAISLLLCRLLLLAVGGMFSRRRENLGMIV